MVLVPWHSEGPRKALLTISHLFVPILKMWRELPRYHVSLSSEKTISLVRDCMISLLYPLTQQHASDRPEPTDQTVTELSCCHQKGQKMTSNARENKCPTTQKCSNGFHADTFFRDRVGSQPQETCRNQTCFLSHTLALDSILTWIMPYLLPTEALFS